MRLAGLIDEVPMLRAGAVSRQPIQPVVVGSHPQPIRLVALAQCTGDAEHRTGADGVLRDDVRLTSPYVAAVVLVGNKVNAGSVWE